MAGTEEGEALRKDLNKTMFNKSSVSHNIITHVNGKESSSRRGKRTQFATGGSSLLNRNPFNHKKSISDFVEEGSSSNPHVTPLYKNMIENNPHMFKKVIGLCTFYGDAATIHKHTVLKPPLRASKIPPASTKAADTPNITQSKGN
jgi:hypothetical protein